MHEKKTSVLPLLALFVVGLHAAASAQTYTSFDALPNGTFPTEIDSSGRIVATLSRPGVSPSVKFLFATPMAASR